MSQNNNKYKHVHLNDVSTVIVQLFDLALLVFLVVVSSLGEDLPKISILGQSFFKCWWGMLVFLNTPHTDFSDFGPRDFLPQALFFTHFESTPHRHFSVLCLQMCSNVDLRFLCDNTDSCASPELKT
jgi:hypothetical protein